MKKCWKMNLFRITKKSLVLFAVILVTLFFASNKAFASGTISTNFDNKTGTLTYSTSSDLYYGFIVSYPGGKESFPYGGGIPGETSMSYSFANYFKESGTYSFQVFAVNKGESLIFYGDTVYNAVAQSERISFNWTKPSAKLATPTNFQWKQSGSAIILQWNKVNNSKCYEIGFYVDGVEKKSIITPNPSWTFALSEFSKGHSYSVTCKAVSADLMAYQDSDVSAMSDSLKLNQNGNPTVNGRAIPGSPEYQEVEYPSDIKLNRSNATLYYGQELKLTATLTPSDAKNKNITWTSSKPAVATVSGGTVKAKSAGEITVTAKTANGLTAACNIVVLAENNPSNPFADVKSGDWKYNAAMYVYEKNYMNGKGNLAGKVLFSPDTSINRSMFVQTLYNVEGKPSVKYNQKFNDVSSSDWFAKPVTWAEKNGIVAGNADGTFGVNGAATREQLAQMFYKYAAYKGYDVKIKSGTGKSVSDFPDADKVSGWAVNSLNWALSRGIMSGKGSGKLDPKGNATRVECATMLRNFMNAYSGEVPKLTSSPELLDEDLLSDELSEEESILPEDVIEKDIQEEKITSEEKEIKAEKDIEEEDIEEEEIKEEEIKEEKETKEAEIKDSNTEVEIQNYDDDLEEEDEEVTEEDSESI